MQDDDGDKESSDGVGELKAWVVEPLAQRGGTQPEEHGKRGPDVRGEVDRVRSQSFGVYFRGDFAQGAGAGIVYGHRQQQNDERPDGEAQVELVSAKEDAMYRFIDDPDR